MAERRVRLPLTTTFEIDLMDIYFCDCCSARVTDADLHRGHGVRKGDVVVCGSCIEQGLGTELLREASERLAVVSAPALAGAGVLDEARDRAMTVPDDDDASVTATVEADSNHFDDEPVDHDRPTAEVDLPVAQAEDSGPRQASDLSGAVDGFAALAGAPAKPEEDDSADDLASGGNPVIDSDGLAETVVSESQPAEDLVRVVDDDGGVYEDTAAAMMPPQGHVDTVIGMQPLNRPSATDDGDDGSEDVSSAQAGGGLGALARSGGGGKGRGGSSRGKKGSSRSGGSKRGGSSGTSARRSAASGNGGGKGSRRSSTGSDRGRSTSDRGRSTSDRGRDSAARRGAGGGSSRSRSTPASRRKKKNQQVVILSVLTAGILLVGGMIALSLSKRGDNTNGPTQSTTPTGMKFTQGRIDGVAGQVRSAIDAARSGLEAGGNVSAGISAAESAMSDYNALMSDYRRWVDHLVGQGMSEDEAIGQLSGLNFASLRNEVQFNLKPLLLRLRNEQ